MKNFNKVFLVVSLLFIDINISINCDNKMNFVLQKNNLQNNLKNLKALPPIEEQAKQGARNNKWRWLAAE